MTDPRLARPLWRGRTNVDALTIACIEHAEALAGHEFVVTKGSYQPPTGDTNSAHTHDWGGVVDLEECGHPECLGHLRRAGLAAFRRTRAQGFTPHFHAAVIGHPLLHPEAATQVEAYLDNTGNGLRGSTRDDGPRFDPIPRPIWPYPEDDMFSDDDRKLLRDTKAAAENAAKQAERARKGSYERDKKLAALISAKVVEAVPAGTIDATVIEEAVKTAIRELVED